MFQVLLAKVSTACSKYFRMYTFVWAMVCLIVINISGCSSMLQPWSYLL
jgi:hypothetical protein